MSTKHQINLCEAYSFIYGIVIWKAQFIQMVFPIFKFFFEMSWVCLWWFNSFAQVDHLPLDDMLWNSMRWLSTVYAGDERNYYWVQHHDHVRKQKLSMKLVNNLSAAAQHILKATSTFAKVKIHTDVSNWWVNINGPRG